MPGWRGRVGVVNIQLTGGAAKCSDFAHKESLCQGSFRPASKVQKVNYSYLYRDRKLAYACDFGAKTTFGPTGHRSRNGWKAVRTNTIPNVTSLAGG